MVMTPRIRKFVLILHIISTIGWIGAIACFLVLAIVGLNSQDVQVVSASYLSMELTARLVIVPLSIISLVSGLIQSFGTKWGLFSHYWVLIKFSLTVFAAIVLYLQLEPISYIAGIDAETILSSSNLRGGRMSLVVHAVGGIVVLLVVTTLSVYKPRGMTRYGWRKQNKYKE
ncbi:DUF2269 domain-containing protein [Alkalihalobacillus deserti]|uniref:DUF2269 domain-containing protein n=1 Tax=Alkalihalobacillus deserti TaxID=2879466 RepID=UPI001D14729F|nr:DUF2269 domain-containing protein [Alkalihalobacillus deserti]